MTIWKSRPPARRGAARVVKAARAFGMGLLLTGGAAVLAIEPHGTATAAPRPFQLQEATIEDIQAAILSKQITTVQVVKLYLARVKAYNGTCVKQPQGILGPIQTVPHAGQLNALMTLNLRPATRKALGFDDRKARSMTDAADNDPNMPDALEVAAAQDREFAKTGKLVGPLQGVVMAIKDQYDTFDMRTTDGADAFYANDRPPEDATFAKRLRAAGAIILGKAGMAEYAAGGARSSFGGVVCDAYDTQRTPNASSSGSGSAVAANLVTCAIAEESSSSIRGPAVANNAVGLAATVELVSRKGMIQSGIHTRVGPICRTVKDAARILDVIAGYDPKDELTVFSVGRTPTRSYASFAEGKRLDGVRLGVLREYMNKKLFTKADEESIDIVDRAVGDLRKLGATIVDPGPQGALFQSCVTRFAPQLRNAALAKQFPNLFPVDDKGKPTTDQVVTLLDMTSDPSKIPPEVTIRNIGTSQAPGEGKFMMDKYLRERGDANIKSNTDLINKARFYDDPHFPDRKKTREVADEAQEFETSVRLQTRFTVQQIVLQCMQEQNLDAVVYPTSNLPPPPLDGPNPPTLNGRGVVWTFLGQQGFPAITVPAGFTTQVYDWVRDPSVAPPPAAAEGGGGNPREGTRMLETPTAAKLPVGIDFLGRPFDEPKLLHIAAVYEAATKHRIAPPDFGPVAGEP
jgi:Asp-tRNA(Asn)/Glu-tRNA(Gln) amidotransferase A subunit family amidase